MPGRRVRQWRNLDPMHRELLVASSHLRLISANYKYETLPRQWFEKMTASWAYRGVLCYLHKRNWLRDTGEDLPESSRRFMADDNFNGYARFQRRPLRERSYGSIVRYVPVHGGITWARPIDDGSFVYGFDTGHYDDEESELYKDPNWAKQEVERMVNAIFIAKRLEKRYRRAGSIKARAKVLDDYFYRLRVGHIGFMEVTRTMPVMVNLLTGQL